MASDASVTVIGHSALLRGDLSGTGDVRIEGTLEGSVQLQGGRITVGPDAKVKALLSAQEIIVHGRVEGELRTGGRAELRANSTVIGKVLAARLSIEDDATLQGYVDCTPAAEKAAPSQGSESGNPELPKAAKGDVSLASEPKANAPTET